MCIRFVSFVYLVLVVLPCKIRQIPSQSLSGNTWIVLVLLSRKNHHWSSYVSPVCGFLLPPHLLPHTSHAMVLRIQCIQRDPLMMGLPPLRRRLMVNNSYSWKTVYPQSRRRHQIVPYASQISRHTL